MLTREWIKKYKDYILVLATILLGCIIYWNYIIGHFSAEAYSVALSFKNYGINAHLVDGRLFSCLLFLLADSIKIPFLIFVSISSVLAIILASIAVFQLKQTITQLVKLNVLQEIVVWVISCCTIFNFMMVEIMYFPEACVIVASILFYIISAKLIIQRKYLYSFLILIIAVFCYQGAIGFFITTSFLFSIIKNKKIGKEVLLDMVRIAIIGIIASGLNLVFIKVISEVLDLYQHKKFYFNIERITNNIKYILSNVYGILLKNCGLFPKYLLLIFVEVILIFSLAVSNYEKKYNVINLIILMLVTIASSFLIFVIQRGSMYTGRVHFVIGSLIGIAMLYLYSVTNIRNKKIWHNIFLVILLSYTIINIVNTINLTYEHQLVNKLAKEECVRIEKMIEQHEKENNIEVTKIVPILVANQKETAFFKETTRRTVVTYNNLRHYYGYTGILQYYLRKNLTTISLNQESINIYLDYIKEHNIPHGEIICIGDTLYCPQYIT